jgi:hypothetical protein
MKEKLTAEYDMNEVNSLMMKKAAEKKKALQEMGAIITPSIAGNIMAEAREEAMKELGPAKVELSEEQLKKVESICKPCALKYRQLMKKPAPGELTAKPTNTK